MVSGVWRMPDIGVELWSCGVVEYVSSMLCSSLELITYQKGLT